MCVCVCVCVSHSSHSQVCQATEEVGGMRAVNCKSGKDRTAIELSVTMARQAVVSGVLTEGAQRPLQAAMQVR